MPKNKCLTINQKSHSVSILKNKNVKKMSIMLIK